MSRPESRLGGLDFLRGVALLLVFVRHVPILPRLHLGWDERILNLFVEVGWLGVDLFFVLSGFLIAGLLFDDVRRHGRVRLLRFWFRRGVKIWPCYFLAYGAWVWAHHLGGQPPVECRAAAILPNALFVQNYFDPRSLWPASWSLAVEEHFYLLLPLVLAAGVAVGRDWSRRRVAFVVGVVGVVGMTVPLVCRVLAAGPGADYHAIYLPTHCRFDCLLVGVLLRYVRDQAPTVFARFVPVATVAAPPLLAAVAAVAIRYRLVENTEIHAWTFTLNAVAFACWVTAAVGAAASPERTAVRAAVAWVGRYSYTIYLVHAVIFHMPWMPRVMASAMNRMGGEDSPGFLWAYRLAYWALSILGGYLLARWFERPVLRWRDRVCPSRKATAEATR